MTRVCWYLENPRYWLEWPSFFFMFAEILWQLNELQALGQMVWQTANRLYPRMDSRTWDGQGPIPGTSAECWGLDGPKGTEGYGWGATLPLHLIRGILGYRECFGQPKVIMLSPAVPEALVSAPGLSLGIKNLGFRQERFDLIYERRENGRFLAKLVFATASCPVRAVRAADGAEVPFSVRPWRDRVEVSFEVEDFCKYAVELRAR